ncbi:MAG: helix-turn-helix domain-containing protein [Fulvivirga sp.]|uniref:helix-turn-helix domain-containing protein n=1 Tax=Fulvivirga sp. TaxID=1931237 RepID=UPI0032F09CE6
MIETSQGLLEQIFSFKNGLELVTGVLGVSQGFYIVRNLKSTTAMLHAAFVFVLGVHFILLSLSNTFNFHLTFIANVFLYMYGPLIWAMCKSINAESTQMYKWLAFFGAVALLISLVYQFIEFNNSLIAAFIDLTYINVFLISGLIILRRHKQNIQINVYQWASRFITIFFITNAFYMFVAYLLYTENDYYIWFKTPVAFLFTFLLIYNIGALFLDKKVLSFLKSPKTLPTIEGLKDRVEKLMKSKKPFLNSGLQLQDLADELGYSGREISLVINQDLNKNFYDYINELRVSYASNLIINQPNLLIKEVMYDSGFSNKVTFNKIFRDKFGCTPSEFKNSLK